MTSNSVSAAAIVVNSAFVSYAGATSTISAATKLTPSNPRMIVLNSRVLQPPVSGVPVAGANAGSSVSISMLKYTGCCVPTRSRIFRMMPSVPMASISRASTISKPQ